MSRDQIAELPDEGIDLDAASPRQCRNGGMATRFGGVVKGIVEAVDGRSFLEWKLLDAERAGVPMVVMNSFATDEPTRSFLGARDDVISFTQSVSLRLNPDGSLFPGPSPYARARRLLRICTTGRAPCPWSAHGDAHNVDNLGARIDPRVLAAHRAGGHPSPSR